MFKYEALLFEISSGEEYLTTIDAHSIQLTSYGTLQVFTPKGTHIFNKNAWKYVVSTDEPEEIIETNHTINLDNGRVVFDVTHYILTPSGAIYGTVQKEVTEGEGENEVKRFDNYREFLYNDNYFDTALII